MCVYIWQYPVRASIFNLNFPKIVVNDIALNFWLFRLSSKIQSCWFNHGRCSPKIPWFFEYHVFRVRTIRPKLGVFFKFCKIQFFHRFITQLVKKLQQWSLYEVIENILPFVLNTKQPLNDIWLLRYKQNSFGCFRKNSEFQFSQKIPKIVLLISQQPNITMRPFCIQNERQDILWHLI